ncbi:hypothetical protein SDC9_203546 [bioreactor metagenome]
MPEVGSIIKTPDGVGKVLDSQVLAEEVKVLMDNKDTVDIRKFKAHEVQILKKPKKTQDSNVHEVEKELKKLED